MSRILLDLTDPTPPYEQLRRGILAEIAAGGLRPGDRLPSIRALARDLDIAPGTVARAYKELEEGGAVRTARGAGTRIAPGADLRASSVASAQRAARVAVLDGEASGAIAAACIDPALQELINDAVAAARDDGYDDRSIMAAVRRALDGAG